MVNTVKQFKQEDSDILDPIFDSASLRGVKTVALFPWGDLFEDFFDTIGVSFESFRDRYVGSYMFGYINALKLYGIRTVLFFVSAQVTETTRFIHKPTNTQVCILPASPLYRRYRSFRGAARKASGVKENQKFSEVYDEEQVRSRLILGVKDSIKSLGSYFSLPLRLLAKEIRNEGCTAILCQEYEHPRFDVCVALGKFLNLPVFATFQGGDASQSSLEYPLRSLALRGCDGVIIPTQSEIQRVTTQYGVPDSKIGRIFNPLDLDAWRVGDRCDARKALGISELAKVVVYHGRIEIQRKGLDVLLEAWKQLCERYPHEDLRLLLVGTGSDAAKFGDLLASMNLQGVRWANEFVSDRAVIQQYLSAGNLYTLPSRHEGFPVAPLEAMSCGVPVVAADAHGIPDIFEHGEADGGLVVPREDASALANAISRVLSDAELQNRMGLAARQRVTSYFSMDVIGKQLGQFMKQLD